MAPARLLVALLALPAAAALISAVPRAGRRPPTMRDVSRRAAGGAGLFGAFGGLLGGPGPANAVPPSRSGAKGATGDVVKVVNGIQHRRLGGSGIVVSEVGLGTQRWCSEDFNAPDERECLAMMDKALLGGGVNLIDTAEQYPIPSRNTPMGASTEGDTERTIGKWLKQGGSSRRAETVVATKITGGGNVNARNIAKDCEGSLARLGTDYLDVYMLHWPARYSPQSNWGQSLSYNQERERPCASLEEICGAMGKLVDQGRIRGWGMCNDNTCVLLPPAPQRSLAASA